MLSGVPRFIIGPAVHRMAVAAPFLFEFVEQQMLDLFTRLLAISKFTPPESGFCVSFNQPQFTLELSHIHINFQPLNE